MALMAMTAAVAQPVRAIPYLESFENGIGDWRTVDGDGDGYGWRRVDYSSVPSMFAPLGYFAHDGSSVLYSESVYDSVPLNPSNWAISPVIEIPASISDSVQFSWWVKAFASGVGDHYEVLLAMVNDTVVDTTRFTDLLFSETISANTYQQRSVNLSDYAGLWVRLAFHHYNSNGSSLQVDYVSVGNDSLPMVRLTGPLSIDAGDTATFMAQLLSGSTSGLTYSWICDDAGYMEYVIGAINRVVWNDGGLFRIGVVATNAFGSDTAWMDVVVSDCGLMDTLPFIENFDALSTTRNCWKMIDDDGNGTAWTMRDGWVESNSVTFFGLVPDADNWLISPPIALGGLNTQFTWQVRPANFSLPAEHYTVYVSTGNGDVYDMSRYTPVFYETLTADSNWQMRFLSLADYADDTIRIAFRHHLTNDQEALQLSNIAIEPAGAPIVQLHAPSRAIVGDSVRFRLDTFSVSAIYDITWRVQIDTFGNYATYSTLDPFAFMWDEFTTEGYYRIYVDVTNDEGTTSDSALVYVKICGIIDSLPYLHTFGIDEDCWRFSDGWFVGDEMIVDGNVVPAAVSFSHDDFGNDLRPDNRLGTPYIHIPDSTYELRFLATEAYSLYSDYAYDHYSVIARANGVTDTLLRSVVGTNDLQRHRIYLGAYAGKNVQFEFYHKASPMGYGLQLAQVEVAPVAEPEVAILAPVRGRTGEQISLGSNVTSSEVLAYQWTLPGATADTLTAPSLTAQWNTAGTYTIILTVTSPLYGAFSDTAQIEIIECSGIEELPYTEHFDVDMACWQSFDLDGDGYGWEMAVGNDPMDRIFGAGMAYGASGNALVSWSTRPLGSLFSYAMSGNGVSLSANNMLVSPAVTLPDTGAWHFSFQAVSAATRFAELFETVSDMYDSVEVLLTTVAPSANPSLSDFTVLLPMQEVDASTYDEISVSLENYLGQTVYIALRHRSSGKVGLLIDEVSINIVEPTMYTVTVTSSDPSMGYVEGGATVAEGSTLTISAAGLPGFHFVQWNDGNTDSVRTVTVTANVAYTAYFAANVGVEDVEESSIVIRPLEGAILVEGNDEQWPVRVFDLAGRLVSQQRAVVSRHPVAQAGVYVVQVGQRHVRKVYVR